ncbi:ankyrin repeat protein [Fowlpox virus]|nr:ankyrin repeat protein [Fowlpox virus]
MFIDSDDNLVNKVMHYEDFHDGDDDDDYYGKMSKPYISQEDDALKYDMVSKYKSTLLLAAHTRRYCVIKVLLDSGYAKANQTDRSMQISPLHIISSIPNLQYLTLHLFKEDDEDDLCLIQEYIDTASKLNLNKSVILAITREVLKGNKKLSDQNIKELADKIIKEELEIAKLLLDKGADINRKDIYGSSALHRAAIGGKQDMVKWLIDNGADVDSQDIFNITPLQNAMLKHTGASKEIVSHVALECFTQNNQVKNMFQHTMKTIDDSSWLKELKISCDKELEKIKSINLNSRYSLLVFLNRNISILSRLVHHPLITNLDVTEFKIYGKKLQDAIKEASKRLSIIKSYIPKIDEVMGNSGWKFIPTEVRYSIVEFLEDKDLSLIDL